ncbi:uncharacterized protein LOC27206417 [Drosophila simulans]|uniref:Uncharacterized protein n=1 Tax=Drosophila simulans TaxID=7240 RepID=A0A0J9R2T2_DROSI|nr:uncharacterized protein LOC27206417 [Drosophila simulans]KMY90124.1 uncharacterized protein Dsimw501_GD17834 [Drosophila simulans]
METLFWLYCFLILNCVDSTQRNFRIVVDHISTKIFDTNTIETLGCQVDQSINCSFVNCHMLLNRQVNKLDARNLLDFVKPNGQEMKLYDGRLDACILLDSIQKNRLVNIYSKSFKRFSNLKCPLKANFNYTMKNLYMDEQDFPSFVPYGTFRSIAQFYLNQTFIASRVIARGKVIPRL